MEAGVVFRLNAVQLCPILKSNSGVKLFSLFFVFFFFLNDGEKRVHVKPAIHYLQTRAK